MDYLATAIGYFVIISSMLAVPTMIVYYGVNKLKGNNIMKWKNIGTMPTEEEARNGLLICHSKGYGTLNELYEVVYFILDCSNSKEWLQLVDIHDIKYWKTINNPEYIEVGER